MSSGNVWCWGADPDGHELLGLAGASDHARPASATTAVTSITDVFAGTFHTCVAHGTSHQIACFGENAQGQIDPTQPYVVADPAVSTAHPFASPSMQFGAGISDLFGAGLHRTCVVTTMATVTSLRCAGLSEDANGGGSDELHTAMGADAIDVGGPLTAIAFGVTHECFIRGGRLYCVGGNDFSAPGTSPTALCGAAMSPCAPTPQTVDSGGTDWAVMGPAPSRSTRARPARPACRAGGATIITRPARARAT